MSGYPEKPYQYERLPALTSIRILELLPGADEDPVSCLLHLTDLSNPVQYEAISYAWGDANIKVPINCDGKRIGVTQNLQTALKYFRFPSKSRFLWADALW